MKKVIDSCTLIIEYSLIFLEDSFVNLKILSTLAWAEPWETFPLMKYFIKYIRHVIFLPTQHVLYLRKCSYYILQVILSFGGIQI